MGRVHLLVGLVIGVLVTCNAEPKCHLNEIQQCVTIAIDYFHTLPKASLAETDDEMSNFCTSLDDAFSCAAGFRDRCMTPIQRELASLILEGASDLKNGFCEPGSALRAKYLTHAKCINKVSQSAEIKSNIEYILATFEKLNSVPDKDKIAYSCCGYAKMDKAFRDQALETCGVEATATAEEIIGTALAQLPSIICNGVDGTEDKCKALLLPDGAKPTDELKGSALYKYLYYALKHWLD